MSAKGCRRKSWRIAKSDVNRVVEDVDRMTVEYQQAKTHRLELEKSVGQATKNVVAARKKLNDYNADLDRLVKAKDDRELTTAKELLDLPIINAFNSPLKIEQIWLPKLTLNNNFSDVARFDRCITCHQAIDKSGAGSAVAPAYPPRPAELVTLSLKTPAAADLPKQFTDSPPATDDERSKALRKSTVWSWPSEGIIDPRDVVVSVVRPESLAADASCKWATCCSTSATSTCRRIAASSIAICSAA